ncbi:MAG: toll/interleukin-1 receptor domain-containing protein [Acidobacteriota bacterium]
MNNYRVFISYSHTDRQLVEQLVEILIENGLTPMWDKNFAYGSGFHEQIQDFIAHAHVFLPVITKESSQRGWVHQEIGYAMALNIPVLPVTLETLPGEMLQQIHAISLKSDLEGAREQLSWNIFDNLVNRYMEPSLALFQCAELAEDRAIMMERFANHVLSLNEYGLVRQKGGLSSFHIPDKVITDPVWKARYDTGFMKSQYHCRCQRNERIALEKHAISQGCRLIIDPLIHHSRYSESAELVRLQTLLEFMESMPDDKVQVAINSNMDREESITIVGDWFIAEAVSSGIAQGYRQTIFTRHAPSMRTKIDLFDQEFNELIQKAGWKAEESRVQVIRDLRSRIEELRSNLQG